MKTLFPSTIRFQLIGLAAVIGFGLVTGSPAAEEKPAVVNQVKLVTSKLGYVAQKVAAAEPGESRFDTVIKQGDAEIARVPNAKPVSFSPDGRILLLAEAADDDSRHFLLNVAGGEVPKPFGKKRDRIGGRYVQKAEWSPDGKTITFTNNATLSDKPTESIVVADHVAKDRVK